MSKIGTLDSVFFEVDNITLSEAKINLVKDKGDSTFNFQHLIDYFESGEPDTAQSRFSANVHQVVLNNVHF